MRKVYTLLLILSIFIVFLCKKEDKAQELGYVLQKWAKAIEKLDYKKYSVCEAYPRSWAVFNEIYKDDYFTDIMVIEVGEPDEDNIKKDIDDWPKTRHAIIDRLKSFNKRQQCLRGLDLVTFRRLAETRGIPNLDHDEIKIIKNCASDLNHVSVEKARSIKEQQQKLMKVLNIT